MAMSIAPALRWELRTLAAPSSPRGARLPPYETAFPPYEAADGSTRASPQYRASLSSPTQPSVPNSPDRPSLASLELEEPPADAVEQELSPVTRKRQVIVLISSFLAVFLTIGINQTYGVFQSYYVTGQDGPDAVMPASQAQNKAFVAFVGTLGAGLTWGGSIFVNPLMARCKDLRYITVTGGCLISLGYGLASLSTQTWHLLLTQGLLYGIGSSMLYFPIVGIAPEYFDQHRGAAMGFVLSGAGIGGLVLSPVVRVLLDHVGIRWTLRVVSFLSLVTSLPIAISASPARGTSRRPTLVSLSVARKPAFILQATAAFLQASGNFVPLTFLPEFSSVLGYTATFGAVLLAINSGANSASRVFLGYAADSVGRQNTLVLSVLGSAISVLAFWLGSAVDGGRGLWLAFVVLYGITAGGFNALFPTIIGEVFGIQAYASVNGFIYFIRGLGAFFGSPVGGVILGDATSPSTTTATSPGMATGNMVPGSQAALLADYRKLIWYDGALLLASSFCVIGVRGFDALERKKWKWKA